MDILVIGGGGREHALAWKLARSGHASTVYVAPGTAGTATEPGIKNVDNGAEDIGSLADFARQQDIGLTIVGPEAPLVGGIVDTFEANGLRCFGPSAGAAQLEGSKAFTKDFMERHRIPTAAYAAFTETEPALAYIREQGAPIVVKADGLAAGKGVTVATSQAEAEAAIDAMMVEKRFGAAGDSLVIEKFLDGEEASFFALVDGETALPLASAQDHKRVGEGETGPNTGGMGAHSPAPVMTPGMEARVMDEIIEPTVRAMKAEGQPYKGVLYAGLMITEDGPQLIEFNVRFGDPENQVLMPRLKSDLLPALMASADGVLANLDLRWHDEAAMTVVMAANGYPGSYEKGSEIRGLEAAAALPGVVVFHAGTKAGADGTVFADGGRVLDVTATAPTIAEARARAYAAVDLIDWPEGFCRRDIGWRAAKT